MTLAEKLVGGGWEIFASDLSTRVLAQAESGRYAMERAEHIPRALLTSTVCVASAVRRAASALIVSYVGE